MVPRAQSGQTIEGGGAGDGPTVDMVDFQPLAHGATGHDAGGISFFERNSLGGCNGAPCVGHGHHVDTLGDQGLEHGVAGPRPGRGHGDGTDARNLAHFVAFDVAPDQRGVVDPHVHRGSGSSVSGAVTGPAGRLGHA